MPRRPTPTLWHVLVLAAILALGAILRFYNLDHRGLLYWDEAKFALEGIRVQASWSHLFSGQSSLVPGKAVGTAKPTHAVLIALAFAILGVHDYAPLFMNGLASLAGIVLTFLIAKRLFGVATGLLSALFLSVSRYDIVYARSGLSESDGNLLLLLAVYLLLAGTRSLGEEEGDPAPRPDTDVLAGLIAGIAFTVNYRLIIWIGVLVLILFAYGPGRRRQSRWTAPLTFAVGCVLAPLAWELLDTGAHLAGITLFRNELSGRPSSYLAEVMYQLHQGKQARLLISPLSYPGWFVDRDGWPALVLLLAGLAAAAVRRTFPWVLAAALVVIPYLIYVFAPFAVPRNLDAAIPFVCILSAATLVLLWFSVSPVVWRGTARRWPAAALALLSVVVFAAAGLAASWQLTAMQSAFARAADYLHRRHQNLALATSEIMVFYLRGNRAGCYARHIPETLPGLSADVRAGFRYGVLENHRTVVLSPYVVSHLTPTVTLPTMGISSGENLISEENGNWPAKPTGREKVQVYAMEELPLPPPSPRLPDRCNPNRVI